VKKHAIVGLLLLSTLGVSACKKGDGAGGSSSAEGCGSDYADPMKQFCITVPKDWVAPAKIGATGPYDELFEIKNADANKYADGVSLTLGFSTTSSKTYEDELAYMEKVKTKSTIDKVEATGATPGGSGKWWATSRQGGQKFLTSIAKAPNGKAISCSPSNTLPSPASLEACKTIRPYPTKK
jgi:hypothetical protein